MNEGEKNQERKFELTTLAPEQHAVTPVPKFTTELPFFYLTKKKDLLQQDIRFEGIDAYGNPIRWEVIPNRSPKIGVPAIEAHTIFTQLVKPVMEMQRDQNGRVPEILPLGGIRECLRAIGWKEGGWEARGLLQGLMQIGQATCDFDFLLPTGETDPEGKPLFRPIKGIFNRFSIWKIGSKHVSEDELAAGNFNFDFDLSDTLYIQLHKVERDIQQSQDQRYLDNQYMFSVEARARRWYELLAAKIFGVVKNGGSYCEIRYSWYVKHHHTLMRLYSRARVVSQMNRIVGDHLASKFITRVEYRLIKDERDGIDFVIRYYPGTGAKDSVSRVLKFINTSTFPILVARRKKRKGGNLGTIFPFENAEARNESIAAVSVNQNGTTTALVDAELLDALAERGIIRAVAINLLSTRSKDQLLDVQDYIDYWDSIRTEKQPGLLVRFIQNADPLPRTFETRRQRADRFAAAARRQQLAAAEAKLIEKYEAYYRVEVDRVISEKISPEEFERRVDAEKATAAESTDSWKMSPELADQLARHAVRLQIAKDVSVLSLAEFRSCEIAGNSEQIQAQPTEPVVEPHAELPPTQETLQNAA